MHTFTDNQVLRLVNMTIQGSNLLPAAFGSEGVEEDIGFLFVMQIPRGPVVEVEDGGRAIHHPKARTAVEQFRGNRGDNSPTCRGRVECFAILPNRRFVVLSIEPNQLARRPSRVIQHIPVEGSIIIPSQVRAWCGRGEIPSELLHAKGRDGGERETRLYQHARSNAQGEIARSPNDKNLPCARLNPGQACTMNHNPGPVSSSWTRTW